MRLIQMVLILSLKNWSKVPMQYDGRPMQSPFQWLNLAKLQLSIVHCSLLTQYGLISIQKIRAHVLSYVLANTRDAQHNMMCYNCIMMCLSENGQKMTSEPQVTTWMMSVSYHHVPFCSWFSWTQLWLVFEQQQQCTGLTWPCWMFTLGLWAAT